jgi:hypothetical protein
MSKSSLGRRLGSLLVASLALGCVQGVSSAEEERPSAAGQPVYVPPPKAPQPAQARSLPVYVPPELGFPGPRVGASTRGGGREATLHLLAPDHQGLTTTDQPTLYWYLAQPTSTRIVVTIQEEDAIAPLLEIELPTPTAPGIHAFRLSDHGARLRPDRGYYWYVSLVPDPERRSQDFTVGASIRYQNPPPALRERLAAARNGGRVFVYAESGVWYDAIAAISAQVVAAPVDPNPRAQRAALLDQVGLSEVAAYDRRDQSAPEAERVPDPDPLERAPRLPAAGDGP